jgi:RNA-directed DNA polymerase
MVHNANQIFANKYNSLMDQVVDLENMRMAIKRVVNNKGVGGTDKMHVQEVRGYLNQHWKEISQQLLNGTYEPKPVRRVEIPKSDGGMRELGIPTVVDRVIQQAINQVLTPIFDPIFSDNSFGFRPGRSAVQAIQQAREYVHEGYDIVVDIDLEKFFDKVNHDILMNKFEQRVTDKIMCTIVRKYLKAGVMINGVCWSRDEGTPQGGPLSPLLSNIILHELDEELEKRGHKSVRYADDCNIYVKSKRAGLRVYDSIRKFIENKLKLKINESKSAVDKTFRRKFLGFITYVKEGAHIGIALKSIERFKDKIRILTQRSQSITMEERIRKLNELLIGWGHYFKIAQAKRTFEELEGWIRRRLRMCRLKEWKSCKTKLRKLRGLGLKKSAAMSIAYSSKKYWRLSIASRVHRALGNQYWKTMGLCSLLEIYKTGCKSL